jgi:hypothetical protein
MSACTSSHASVVVGVFLWLQVAQPPGSGTPAQSAQLEAAVTGALQQYAAAYESMDANNVKKIWPNVDVDSLKRAFGDMRSLKVTIDTVRVLEVEGATARVSFRVTQEVTFKAGARPKPITVIRVARLRRQEAVWVIDGFER